MVKQIPDVAPVTTHFALLLEITVKGMGVRGGYVSDSKRHLSVDFFLQILNLFHFLTSLYAERRASSTNSFGTLFRSKVVAPFSPHLFETG